MISDQLYNRLVKLPKKIILNVMLEALDYKDAYNGRSDLTCIALAVGAEDKAGDDGNEKWTFPLNKEIKKICNSPPTL